MKVELKDINLIKPYEKNPRKNLNITKVANSIKEFGFQQPIVVDNNMTIIVGHTRFEASKKLGLKEVPVLIADLPEEKIKAYRIADNRLSQDSSWDLTLLNEELKDLLNTDYSLSNLGFFEQELESILTTVKHNYNDTEIFTPTINPDFGNKDITNNDIAEANQKEKDRFQNKEQNQKNIMCPNCYHEFLIKNDK